MTVHAISDLPGLTWRRSSHCLHNGNCAARAAYRCPDCNAEVTSSSGIVFWCPGCRKTVPAANLGQSTPRPRLRP